MRRIPFGKVLVVAVMLLWVAGLANAANVYLINGNSTGSTPGIDWNTPSMWSNNAAPTADNDYYVSRDENWNYIQAAGVPAGTIGNWTQNGYYHCRATGTFPGKSLTIGQGGPAGAKNGSLSLRPSTTAPGSTYQVDDLRLTSATISNQATNGIGTFAGNITLGGGNNSLSCSSGNRVMTYTANIKGTCGTLNVGMSTNAGDVTTFAPATGSNTFSVTTLTQANGTFNIAGTAAIGHPAVFTSSGTIAPTADLSMPTTDLILRAVAANIKLDFPVTVRTLTVTNAAGAQAVATGVYHAADLTTQFPGQFSGTSTITVVGAAPVATPTPTPTPTPYLSAPTARVHFPDVHTVAAGGATLAGSVVPSTVTVTLRNTGTVALTFTGSGTNPGLAISGTAASMFTIKSVTPSTASALAANGTVAIVLQYAPPKGHPEGTFDTATLTVTSNASNSPTAINLVGLSVPVGISRVNAE